MFLQCLYMSFAVSITIMAVTMIVKKTQHKDYVSVSLHSSLDVVDGSRL